MPEQILTSFSACKSGSGGRKTDSKNKNKKKMMSTGKEVTAITAQGYFYTPRGLQCILCLQ